MTENTGIDAIGDDNLADEALDERHGGKLALRYVTSCASCIGGRSQGR